MNYNDEYTDLAQDYDLFDEIDNVNEAEKEFISSLFSEFHTKNVLDCACGTGNHLIMLSHLGFEVYGSDYSAAMLQMCKCNLKKFGIQAVTKQCDYRKLELVWDQKFDAVLCLTQAINHMLTKEDLVAALTSMRGRLNPNGILILTQGTTHKTLQDQYRFDLVVNNPDFSRVFSRDIGEEFQTIHILDIFHSAERSEMKKHDITIKIILDEEFRQLLTEAGFSKVDIYGGYDRSPYDRENSWKLIVVGRA